MTTQINNENKKLNFSNEREQSQTCLNSAEHEKNQGRKVLNVPNLRFPEFQGEWTTSLLSDYLTENKERNKKGEFDKTDVLSVSGDYGIVNQIELLGRSFAGASVLPYHVVRHGNIVYTKSPLKEYPYGIVKANTGVDGIVSTLYAVYNIKNNVDAQFIEYYFSSANRTNRYFKPIVRIGAKHDMKIGNQEVLANKVTFPNLEEQTKIASLFRFLDERIATQNKIIEDLKKLKSAISKHLFSRKDLLETTIRLADIATLKNGYAFQSSKYDTKGKWKILTIANVSGERYINDDDCNCIINLPNDIQDHQVLKEGDILISLTGNVGRVSLCKAGNNLLNQRVGLLCITRNANQEFLYQVLSSRRFENSMVACGQGAAQMNIGKGDIESYVLPYSSNVNNIRMIAEILQSYDEFIINELRILTLLTLQRQYLLQQMFI